MSTLAQFRTAVTAKIGLDNTASSAEQGYVDTWLNEGVVRVLMDTQCYVVSGTTTLTSGTGDYTLDAAVLDIVSVYISSSNPSKPLTRLTPHEILLLRQGSSTNSSPASAFAVNGANMLMVWPTPASADTLTFYYIPRPTAMSSASHDPSNATYGGVPSEYHKAVEFYACWQAADYDDDQSSAQGERYRQQYDNEIHRVRRRMLGKGGGPLPRARLAVRTNTYFRPRDNSTDVRWP